MDKNNKKKYQLQIGIKTYIPKSDGIYDFSTKKYRQILDETDEDLYYIRKRNNCITKRNIQSDIDFGKDDILFRTRKSKKNDNLYEIINPVRKNLKKNKENINNLNNKPWLVIGSESDCCQDENEDYILNENDILKLGVKKYEVIEKNINISKDKDTVNKNDCYNISQMNKQKGSIFDINIEKNQYKSEKIKNKENELKNECSQNIKESENIYDIKRENDEENELAKFQLNENSIEQMETGEKEESNENERCQICLEDVSTRENPLLKLCKCENWIHYECLKHYINTKMKISENEKFTVKTYICKKFNCDICLAPYPLRFIIKEYNKLYRLIDYNIAPELNHIVLESLDYINKGMNEKIVHVVQLIDNKIFIGRSLQNDIIDHHTSVSRNHAVLKFNRENGDLTIENRSKTFGTLVLIKDNIKMKEKKICFRVGKSLITSRLVEKIETKGE
jgi:hypothetical protein